MCKGGHNEHSFSVVAYEFEQPEAGSKLDLFARLHLKHTRLRQQENCLSASRAHLAQAEVVQMPLKFIYSGKATKIWCNLPLNFDSTQ